MLLTDFKRYMESIDLKDLLEKLGASNIDMILKEVEHFTEKEAEKRDKILDDYFGESGINAIVEAIVNRFISPLKLKTKPKILDVGAGSGLFTIRILNEIRSHVPGALFYAMDITPAMLYLLSKKTSEATPFIGLAENITGSIKLARSNLELPERFDAVFSTLMLHHCLDVKKVFESISRVLEKDGKAIVIDICEHPFTEFREEMGDIHLGFKPSMIEEYVSIFFSKYIVEKIPGICCESSGRMAELFIAYLSEPRNL